MHPHLSAGLCAGIFALTIAVVATPALSQGTGGGAGGESGSSSAMPQPRNPMISSELRPRFREYVVREARPSFRYSGQVVVGAELPSADVTYYEVPAEYGVRQYRYTIVNDQPVLVDPGSHRIIQIID